MDLIARLSLVAPSKASMPEVIALFTQLGFNIPHSTTRSLTLKGSKELFEKTFKAKIGYRESHAQFVTPPQIPQQLNVSARVYFPTPPNFFGSAQ